MGTDALATSGITAKILYLLQDRRFVAASDPLGRVRKSRIVLFLALELMGFGATMAITQTIGTAIPFLFCAHLIRTDSPVPLHAMHTLFTSYEAAIGFPVIIGLLIPFRVFIIPRLPFTSDELSVLDGPTASPFVSMALKKSLSRPLIAHISVWYADDGFRWRLDMKFVLQSRSGATRTS